MMIPIAIPHNVLDKLFELLKTFHSSLSFGGRIDISTFVFDL